MQEHFMRSNGNADLLDAAQRIEGIERGKHAGWEKGETVAVKRMYGKLDARKEKKKREREREKQQRGSSNSRKMLLEKTSGERDAILLLFRYLCTR